MRQARPAGRQCRAVIDPGLNQALDMLELLLVDDGTDVIALLHRIAHFTGFDLRGHERDDLVIN